MVVEVGFFRYALFEAAGLEKLWVGLVCLCFSLETVKQIIFRNIPPGAATCRG